MVVLDMANTRLKDFLDIWTLAQAREFAGELLARAVAATFKRRKTALPTSTPVALSPMFATNELKQIQWRAYLRKVHASGAPEKLADAVTGIRTLLMPLLEAIAAGESFEGLWLPRGPWSR